ncbi:MAG TPA: hypothetical protein VIH90_03280 [Candidatus Saccharimonadales bacterium]
MNTRDWEVADGVGSAMLAEISENVELWGSFGDNFDGLNEAYGELTDKANFWLNEACGADIGVPYRDVPASSVEDIKRIVKRAGATDATLADGYAVHTLFERLKAIRYGTSLDAALNRFARLAITAEGVTTGDSAIFSERDRVIPITRQLVGVVDQFVSSGERGGIIVLRDGLSYRRYSGLVASDGSPRVELDLSTKVAR